MNHIFQVLTNLRSSTTSGNRRHFIFSHKSTSLYPKKYVNTIQIGINQFILRESIDNIKEYMNTMY